MHKTAKSEAKSRLNTTAPQPFDLTKEEVWEISRALEKYHSVFDKFWSIGKPKFTTAIGTACVSFNDKGQFIEFLFNPEFWKRLNKTERNFVIVHECLHLILNHGPRILAITNTARHKHSKTLPAQESPAMKAANIAADIVVNEMALNGFGFSLEDMPTLAKIGYWIKNTKSLFGKPLEQGKSLETYYAQISTSMQAQACKKASTRSLIDVHQPPTGGSGLTDMPEEALQEVAGGVMEQLDDYAKESLLQTMKSHIPSELTEIKESESKNPTKNGRGSMAGALMMQVNVDKVPVKRKWETVIRNWVVKSLKLSDRQDEQWARINRRFVNLQDKNMFLPSEMEEEARDNEKKRIKVIFFQDTSGSCQHLAKRFFAAAKSLPKDKFDVDLYCFDTQVYKTDLESGKLYGFGGTSFDILETKVQEIAAADKQYPKAVFVITDGQGNRVNPAIPKNWHWFLSTNYKSCIPKECNTYELSKFE